MEQTYNRQLAILVANLPLKYSKLIENDESWVYFIIIVVVVVRDYFLH